MTEPPLESLLSARRKLISSLAKSRHVANSLAGADPRLDNLRRRLAVAGRLEPPHCSSLAAHIDRAAAPTAAVLRAFNAVRSLESPILNADPSRDLAAYLAAIRRLEDALEFLSANVGLAVRWLDALAAHIADENHALAGRQFIAELNSTLAALKSSPPSLDDGVLAAVLHNLAVEFRRRLDVDVVAADRSPQIVLDLSAIVERMSANGRLDVCVSVFVDVRGSIIRERFEIFDIADDLDDAQSIGDCIHQWGCHLELSVRQLFEPEFEFCEKVFDKCSNEGVAESCLAEISVRAGILRFIRFGRMVTELRKDPVKLLKLLDIFGYLSKLRVDFNRLFGGKASAEIQKETRDLIKRIVDGACEIFWELFAQVEMQRKSLLPADGSVPKLVSFMIDYCNKLLSDEYQQVLYQVLVIQRSWKQEKAQKGLLTNEITDIVKALEGNVEVWSKGYDDRLFMYLFLMNTHCYFYKYLKGTKVGELLGDAWLRDHEHYKEHYAVMFVRESWGKLSSLLSGEGLILFSGGKTIARDLVKKQLKFFNETFEDMYQRQSKWVISDRELREKMLQLVLQAIVPVYRSYLLNYGSLLDQDASKSNYVKYTSENMEKILVSLFQHRLRKSGSLKIRHFNERENQIVTPLYRSASTVVR